MSEMLYAYHRVTKEEFHVDSPFVKIGLNEDLFCYCCDLPIVARAKNSLGITSHFAHLPTHNENSSKHEKKELFQSYTETLLHERAKKYIQNQFTIKVPLSMVEAQSQQYDYNGDAFYPEKYKYPFDTLHTNGIGILEKERNGIIPDVILNITEEKRPNFELFVEIYVTHKVDHSKIKKIISNNQNCIEIDLSNFDRELIDNKEYFENQMNNIQNYKAINIIYDGYNDQLQSFEDEYSSLLEKHNAQIIRNKEYFIKKALDNNHNVTHIKEKNFKNQYFCICCKQKLIPKNNYFSHEKESNCIIFSKTKQSGVLYNQLLVANLFFNHIKNKSSLMFEDIELFIDNVKGSSKDGKYYLQLFFKNTSENFLIQVFFDEQSARKSRGHSIFLNRWKEYADFVDIKDFTEHFHFNQSFDNLGLYERIEHHNFQFEKRKIESNNQSHIDYFQDSNGLLVHKKDVNLNNDYKCIFCENVLNNSLQHININSCALFENISSESIQNLQKNQIFLYKSFLKLKKYFQAYKKNNFVSVFKDYIPNIELKFLEQTFSTLIFNDILLDFSRKCIRITFFDNFKKEHIFHIQKYAVSEYQSSNSYDSDYIFHLKEQYSYNNGVQFFSDNFSKITDKGRKKLDHNYLIYRHEKENNYQTLIAHLKFLGKKEKNPSSSIRESLNERLLMYKNNKFISHLHKKTLMLLDDSILINKIIPQYDDKKNIISLLINDNIFIKQGYGELHYHYFYQNICNTNIPDNFKGYIITLDFNSDWIQNKHFSLSTEYLDNIAILTDDEKILSIKYDYFKEFYLEPILQSNPEHDSYYKAIQFYLSNEDIFKKLITNSKKYTFILNLLNYQEQHPDNLIATSLLEKAKNINSYNFQIKDIILHYINNQSFEKTIHKFINNPAIFSIEEQEKFLKKPPELNIDNSIFFKNISLLLTSEFLNQKKDSYYSERVSCFLSMKQGQSFDESTIISIFGPKKLKFGKKI